MGLSSRPAGSRKLFHARLPQVAAPSSRPVVKEVNIVPGFDGSGPRGAGPMTGRGRGYCIVPLTSEMSGVSTWKPFSFRVIRGRRKYSSKPCTWRKKTY
ncbi:DUF5320 domain-containing protein [Desulfofundulus australicus]|uniref:DUF5320 domain-containing protein n=1 Tax=Desulfofundulus australicus TaxID=1566 RepID=UPI003BFA363F